MSKWKVNKLVKFKERKYIKGGSPIQTCIFVFMIQLSVTEVTEEVGTVFCGHHLQNMSLLQSC